MTAASTSYEKFSMYTIISLLVIATVICKSERDFHIETSRNRHIVIIGAGIGGGRIKTIKVFGKVIEVGAAAWATSNRYLVELVKELQIPVEVAGVNLQNVATVNKGSLISWDGYRSWDLIELLQNNTLSTLKVAIELGAFLTRLELNYLEFDLTDKPFLSIPDFLKTGSLTSYVSASGKDFFKGIRSDLKFAGMDPMIRHIYHQQLDSTHAFSCLVTLTSAAETAYSVKGGNSKLPMALLSASGATAQYQSIVTSLTQNTDKSYSVDYRTETGKTATVHADAVVIAAPLEWTGIEFINFKPTTRQPIRNWVNWFVTIVAATRVNPRHFGQNESWTEPEFILTTSNASTPWVSIQYLDTAGMVNIYKIFSDVNMTTFLDEIFIGVVQVYDHFWPYTFPVMGPLTKDSQYQSIKLANGLYNINTMESVVSAMEGSVISGRNVAKMVTEYLTDLH
ncbi:uncharacterized protein [Ptychodera flava]|uniref:uncharacterized protein isoform X2 n=1 Tax=Ptychodera flava TaxID=63121 RepID=UPI00396A4A5F